MRCKILFVFQTQTTTLSNVCQFYYPDNDNDNDDDGDLVDEDNDSWQAPAVTLVEQQKIYGIAAEYTHCGGHVNDTQSVWDTPSGS